MNKKYLIDIDLKLLDFIINPKKEFIQNLSDDLVQNICLGLSDKYLDNYIDKYRRTNILLVNDNLELIDWIIKFENILHNEFIEIIESEIDLNKANIDVGDLDLNGNLRKLLDYSKKNCDDLFNEIIYKYIDKYNDIESIFTEKSKIILKLYKERKNIILENYKDFFKKSRLFSKEQKEKLANLTSEDLERIDEIVPFLASDENGFLEMYDSVYDVVDDKNLIEEFFSVNDSIFNQVIYNQIIVERDQNIYSSLLSSKNLKSKTNQQFYEFFKNLNEYEREEFINHVISTISLGFNSTKAINITFDLDKIKKSNFRTLIISPIREFDLDTRKNTFNGIFAHELGHAITTDNYNDFSNLDEYSLINEYINEHFSNKGYTITKREKKALTSPLFSDINPSVYLITNFLIEPFINDNIDTFIEVNSTRKIEGLRKLMGTDNFDNYLSFLQEYFDFYNNHGLQVDFIINDYINNNDEINDYINSLKPKKKKLQKSN